MKHNRICYFIFLSFAISLASFKSVNVIKEEMTAARSNYTILQILPSSTDPSIKYFDFPHLVMYNPEIKNGKILLFLPGTGGIPPEGPKNFYKTAVDQGYVLISLAYADTPAVAMVCHGKNLEENSDCASDFRERRIYGTISFPLINDKPQDAIINRFAKLLMYLSKNDLNLNWGQYLDNGKPVWEKIAVSGQSQGGGMAAYIAKTNQVTRVIDFSGGWDFSSKGKIANWYFSKSITPAERWFGLYNQNEPTANIILKTYEAMDIPQNQIYALNLPVREGKMAHTEGLANIEYKPKWIEVLGNGN